MKGSYAKIIIAGSIIDYTEYTQLNVENDPINAREKRETTENCEGLFADENYAKTQRYRRSKVRQLINANYDSNSKFITLTHRENTVDLPKAQRKFKIFIKELRKTYPDLKYVAVIEFQKRGSIHYHMICNLPYVPAKYIENKWKQGYVKINKIKHVDNIGAYVTKYMTEDMDDKRLQGKKAYNHSQNNTKPMLLTSWKNSSQTQFIYDNYCKDKKSLVYERLIHTQDHGTILFRQYNFNRKPQKDATTTK